MYLVFKFENRTLKYWNVIPFTAYGLGSPLGTAYTNFDSEFHCAALWQYSITSHVEEMSLPLLSVKFVIELLLMHLQL